MSSQIYTQKKQHNGDKLEVHWDNYRKIKYEQHIVYLLAALGNLIRMFLSYDRFISPIK